MGNFNFESPAARFEIINAIKNFSYIVYSNPFDEENSDGSLKKNTAFIKKLKKVHADNFSMIINEFNRVKCIKFLDEMAQALLQNSLDGAEVCLAISNIATIINSRYNYFNKIFVDLLTTSLSGSKATDQTFGYTILIILLSVPFEIDFNTKIFPILQRLASSIDFTCQNNELLNFFIFIFSCFYKDTTYPSSLFTELGNLIFDNSVAALSRKKAKLNASLEKARSFYETKGDISSESVLSLTEMNQDTSCFELNLSDLANVLGREMPQFRSVKNVEIGEKMITFRDPSFVDFQAFDSPEEQSFYEDFGNCIISDSTLLIDLSDDISIKEIDPDKETCKENLFSKLESSLSVDEIDSLGKLIADYPKYDNSLIIKSFFVMTRRRPDLIKNACRCAIIISNTKSEFMLDLVRFLEGQFRFLIKLPFSYAWSRTRTAICLGELCKFRQVGEGQIFSCLKRALSDLTNSNVLFVCSLIETCGRYLNSLESSQKRLQHIVDALQKLKSRVITDASVISAINVAINSIKPSKFVKWIIPMDERIQFFKFSITDRIDIDILKIISCFPFQISLFYSELLICFVKSWKFNFSKIPLLSNLAKNISLFYPSWTCLLIDVLIYSFEEIIESPTSLYHGQHSVSIFSFLVYLFKASLIDFSTFMRILSNLHKFMLLYFEDCNLEKCKLIISCLLQLAEIFPDFSTLQWGIPFIASLEAIYNEYYLESIHDQIYFFLLVNQIFSLRDQVALLRLSP